MQRLGSAAGGLDAVVWGTIRRRGTKLHVQCDLIATASGETLAAPSSVLPLSEGLVADTGASFDNRQRPGGVPHAPEVVAHVQQQAHDPHPLLQPDFPFRVEIWTIDAGPGEPITPQTKRRKKDFLTLPAEAGQPGREQSQLLIGARQDEQFEVRIWNKTGNRVALRLLLDGLNSLEQRRERLDLAASWVIDPAGAADQPTVIPGWYLREAAASDAYTMKRFKFVDIAEGVATRQKFGESIGLITAAFYFEGGRSQPAGSGRLAIGEGQQERQRLNSTPFRVGPLAAVAQIRYVSEAELEKLLGN
jgi:hypothetical protein